MFGIDKCFESSSPQNDIWGTFNSNIQGKVLLHVKELEYNDFKNYDSKIKDLITDRHTVINSKGVNQVQIDSFH